jgi:hypothetical protein
MQANGPKSIHVTFFTRKETCPPPPPPPDPYKQCATPQEDDAKYLGLHHVRRLTWHKHIFVKRKQLGIILTKIYWQLLRKSILCTSNKLLIQNNIQPIWTYGMQLWGTASTSNKKILECFQTKALRIIVDALWYVPNTVIRRDPQIAVVKEEIRRYSSQYSARLSAHPNDLILNLM